MNQPHLNFINQAIKMAEKGMNANAGGPFGCVITLNNEIIAEGHNEVTSTNDPTAHAEMVTIRKACQKLESFQLTDCVIYTSCEPCPMCLGAIYWARPKMVYYSLTKEDAAKINFDDQFIYDELEVPMSQRMIPFARLESQLASKVFLDWAEKMDKVKY